MELENKYEVTPKKRSEDFKKALNQIMKDFISNECKSNTPLFILAGGQPGSGKTALIDTIKQQNQKDNFVVIDLDNYRKYHPDFEEIKEKHKKDGVLLTNSFAFAVENAMLSYVIENKLNTINVSTLRNTDMIEQFIIKRINPNGFRISAYIMAVIPEESYFSALKRYLEQQRDPNCVIRHTGKDFHDISYRNLDITIKMLEKLGVPITICKRAPKKEEPAQIVCRDSLEDSLSKIEQIRKNEKDSIITKIQRENLDFPDEDIEIKKEYITFKKDLDILSN